MHKAIVPLEIEDSPVSETRVTVEPSDEEPHQDIQPKKGGIQVFIRTCDGLQMKKGLNYQGLVSLVEKLEGLC